MRLAGLKFISLACLDRALSSENHLIFISGLLTTNASLVWNIAFGWKNFLVCCLQLSLA
uniref:Uncharacterized protein n=1 Tax=Arundo donax TaxID=35708 RepID=A0A0A9A703_ARUDO